MPAYKENMAEVSEKRLSHGTPVFLRKNISIPFLLDGTPPLS